MKVPNSHLPSGSLRGWLLATGEGRWKSTTKSSLASKWHSIWICYLKADVGGAAHSSDPGGRSQITDSDEAGSCSHLMARQDELRSATAHQMMFAVHPLKKPCGQWWQEKQQVDDLWTCLKSTP